MVCHTIHRSGFAMCMQAWQHVAYIIPIIGDHLYMKSHMVPHAIMRTPIQPHTNTYYAFAKKTTQLKKHRSRLKLSMRSFLRFYQVCLSKTRMCNNKEGVHAYIYRKAYQTNLQPYTRWPQEQCRSEFALRLLVVGLRRQ
jgi:hypothetical protein